MTSARVLTAAVLIPAAVAVVWWGSTGLVAGLAGLVLLLALLEFLALGARAGFHGYRLWTGFCALALLFGQYTLARQETWMLGARLQVMRTGDALTIPLEVVLLLFLFGAAGVALASRTPPPDVLPALGISTVGLVFVALPFSYLVRLHGVGSQGRGLLLFLLVFIWVGDTLAFFVGRSVGRLPLAPQISPQKTWEGSVANLIGSMLVAAAFVPFLTIEPRHLLLMAALGNIAGQAGDLLESAYKRSAGVKDSSSLLPGHGGVLDRIDALILATPVVWYYFDLVVAHRG
ncbi:MAG TPA: phosphatidate cytidylyltransferase [Candidatus Acidoferrales bacterium]|nr:phosphatidate cytidylyltransferase [Candidatus Acidoferrales bacterium]